MKIKAIKIKTRYWKPGTDYLKEIVEAVKNHVMDGDILTISEKAISTSQGNIVDESLVKAGIVAGFITHFWMRKMWGGPLGKLARLRKHTLDRLKNFPLAEGASHKQVALENVGFLQSLRHYSEGGIDASNLPYSYVSLPLKNPEKHAKEITDTLKKEGISVKTLIVDGDTTYSWRNLHFAPRIVHTPGLIHIGGFLTFLIGRWLGFKSRSTPIAIAGGDMNPDWALTLANISHRIRGHGAGRTVWEMVENLGVALTEVKWYMLDRVDHYPLLIIRRVN